MQTAVAYTLLFTHVGDWIPLKLEESIVELPDETSMCDYQHVSIIFSLFQSREPQEFPRSVEHHIGRLPALRLKFADRNPKLNGSLLLAAMRLSFELPARLLANERSVAHGPLDVVLRHFRKSLLGAPEVTHVDGVELRVPQSVADQVGLVEAERRELAGEVALQHAQFVGSGLPVPNNCVLD